MTDDQRDLLEEALDSIAGARLPLQNAHPGYATAHVESILLAPAESHWSFTAI